jgi:hypothetical protein
VLITPHTVGETQRYEDNVPIPVENLHWLASGETRLKNQIA